MTIQNQARGIKDDSDRLKAQVQGDANYRKLKI